MCRTCYVYVYIDFVYVKFVSLTQPHIFTPSQYFVMADLKPIFLTEFEGIFIIYPHTKFHIPRRN